MNVLWTKNSSWISMKMSESRRLDKDLLTIDNENTKSSRKTCFKRRTQKTLLTKSNNFNDCGLRSSHDWPGSVTRFREIKFKLEFRINYTSNILMGWKWKVWAIRKVTNLSYPKIELGGWCTEAKLIALASTAFLLNDETWVFARWEKI